MFHYVFDAGGIISFASHTLQGKLDTEKLLTDKGINFTSVRPVYIYGPLNYNPVEEWFFHRIKAGRPIPVPNSGQQVSHAVLPPVALCHIGSLLLLHTWEHHDMLLCWLFQFTSE